jgi:PAS domain S-box-containing protein
LKKGKLEEHGKIIMPAINLLAAAIVVAIVALTYPASDSVNYVNVSKDIIQVGISFLIIIIAHRLVKDRDSYLLAHFGFSIIFLASVDELMRELFLSGSALWGYRMQDLMWIGLAFVGIAIFKRTKTLTESDSRYTALSSQYLDLLEALPEGVAIGSLDETITFANEKFAKILGLEEKDVVGKKFIDFVDPVEVDRIIGQSKTREQGMPSVYSVRMFSKSGERRIVRVSAVPKMNGQGKVEGVISVIMDITERIKSEEEKAMQEREKELYASLLQHDLGNDLQVILGYIDGVRMLTHGMPDPAKDMLESAQAASVRMANLLKALGAPAQPSDEGIGPFLERIASECEKANRGLSIEVNADKGTRNLKPTGSSLLPMAFENIFRNAAMHAGLEAIVNVRISRHDGSLSILISDNGPGIPDDKRSKLFHRGASTGRGGLGLYLTKQILNACGGSIQLRNIDGQEGATFEVNLPLEL